MSHINSEESSVPLASRIYRLVAGENRQPRPLLDRMTGRSASAPEHSIPTHGAPEAGQTRWGNAALAWSGQWGAVARERLPLARPLLLPGLVFLGSFLVYLFTAAPTVFGWDSAEFAATAYTLGLPHATGYPLYVLLGKLFTLLPFGDVGFRLNLMSAVFASATAALVYLICIHLTRRVILSIAAAGTLAFSYYFWAASVIAEVYTLHTFLNAGTIYLLLLWRAGGRDRLLYAGIFLWGLSFGNHMTTVLMGPAIAFLLGMALWQRRIQPRQIIALAAVFLAPLAIYLYMPIRYLAQAEPWVIGQYTAEGVLVRVNPTTIGGMWEILTARQFEILFMAHLQQSSYIDELRELMFTVYANFLGAGLVLGLLGILRNFLVDKERLLFLGLIFVANLLFFADYGAVDKYFMFVTGFMIWTFWMAEGFYLIFNSLERHLPGRWPVRLQGNWAHWVGRVRPEALSLVLVAAALWVNLSYTNLNSYTYMKDTYPGMMESIEPNALVLAWWVDTAMFQYFQKVEEVRPDVQFIDRFLISEENERKLIENSLAHRPVYVFEGYVRQVPYPKYEPPYLWGSYDTGYRIIPP